MTTDTAMDVEAYAVRYPQLGPAVRMAADLVAALGRLGPGDVVLDVGCGEGVTLSALAEAFPEQRHIGVEASVHRSVRARAVGAEVLVSDGANMGIADDSVSLVLNRHVIEHVPDDEALLREIHRVLRPGGVLYLETPLRLPGAWYPYRNSVGRRVLDPTHVREYSSPDTVVDLLTRAGFTGVSLHVGKLRFPLDEMATKGLVRMGIDPLRAERLGKSVNARVPVLRYREISCTAMKAARSASRGVTSGPRDRGPTAGLVRARPSVAMISRYAPRGHIHHGRGLNSYAKNLATTLAAAGVDVTVLGDRSDGEDERYTEDGVHVHRVWTVGGTDVARLVSEVETLRPSLVHLQYELFMFGPSRSALVPPVLMRRLRSTVPLVTTIHGVIPPRDFRALASSYARHVPPEATRRLYGSVVRRVIRSSDLVIAHNWSLLTSISSYGNPSAARVIPLGVDRPGPRRDRVEALARFDLDDRRRAVFFGFLLPYKGLDTLERAAPLLAREGVEVLVAGGNSGDARSTFSRSHRGSGHGGVVRIGYVEEDAIADLFALTDVLVLPYRFGLAGSGPLALAATNRTPVVVSDVPSIAETLDVPAATFVRNDPAALAEAVLRVLDDPAVRSQVLKRLDELVADHSWEMVAAATVEAYESLAPAGV